MYQYLLRVLSVLNQLLQFQVQTLPSLSTKWHHNPLPASSPQDVGTFYAFFATYLQKSQIQLELLPHLIKDTYVTNMLSIFIVFFKSLIQLYCFVFFFYIFFKAWDHCNWLTAVVVFLPNQAVILLCFQCMYINFIILYFFSLSLCFFITLWAKLIK